MTEVDTDPKLAKKKKKKDKKRKTEDTKPELLENDEDPNEPEVEMNEKRKRKKKNKQTSDMDEEVIKESTNPAKEITKSRTMNPNVEMEPKDSKDPNRSDKKIKKKKKRKHHEANGEATDSKVLQAQADPNDTPALNSTHQHPSTQPSHPSRDENSPDEPDTTITLNSTEKINGVIKTEKHKKEDRNQKSNQSAQQPSIGKTSSLSSHELEQFISSNHVTYEPSDVSERFPPVLRFEDVKVHTSLRAAFSTFEKPSPIQSAVWPVLISGRDVIGIAETGSGKTLAFGVPALQHILNNHGKSKTPSGVKVLVIAPTRELAMQTETTLSELGQLVSPPIKTLCVYGGVDKNGQIKVLLSPGIQIVVGTPGRLLDLANDGHLKLGQVSWLILDEADRMLDKGFENDIRAIINLCLPSGAQNPKSRLTTMFSATWPTSVRRLAADFMHEPVRILVGADELTASCSVEQTVEVLEDRRVKEAKLLDTLRQLQRANQKNGSGGSQKDKIIVFALYKKEAQRLYEFLLRKGFYACCIEGNMSQDKRSQSLQDFMTGKATILVATDVAARGLDIPKVEFVINVTFPLTIEDYIHRIGRTGRAGRTGKSITFFTDEDKSHAGELMRVLKDAGQVVPEDLKQWGGQIKKKTHAAYGDHWKEVDLTVKAKKITFD